ncbi:MAG: hypothetical protein ACUVXD_13960 [Thermodesulfobacteriota bacterium]
MARGIKPLVLSIAFFILTGALSPAHDAHAQIRILSHRVAPSPPVFGMSYWILIDFERGPVAKIHMDVASVHKGGQRRVIRNSFPPQRPFEGMQSGTLTLFDLPRDDPDLDPKRFVTIVLEDRNGNRTEPLELTVVPSAEWQAASPIRLLEVGSETEPPRADGEKNWLRITFDKETIVRPEVLYMEWESDRHKGLQEMRVLDKVAASGQARCWWSAVGHGERTFRFWLVDERGEQSNFLETKVSF